MSQCSWKKIKRHFWISLEQFSYYLIELKKWSMYLNVKFHRPFIIAGRVILENGLFSSKNHKISVSFKIYSFLQLFIEFICRSDSLFMHYEVSVEFMFIYFFLLLKFFEVFCCWIFRGDLVQKIDKILRFM